VQRLIIRWGTNGKAAGSTHLKRGAKHGEGMRQLNDHHRKKMSGAGAGKFPRGKGGGGAVVLASNGSITA